MSVEVREIVYVAGDRGLSGSICSRVAADFCQWIGTRRSSQANTWQAQGCGCRQRTGAPEEAVDVRKREKKRAIPFLNRLLQWLEEDGRLTELLSQSESNWTPAILVLLTIALWLIGATLITYQTRFLPLAFILGLIPAAVPVVYLQQKRDRRLRNSRKVCPRRSI